MPHQTYQIQSIRDIRFIYLYEMPYGKQSDGRQPYYGMKIILKNNTVLNRTHRDAQFNQFVQKVYQTYQMEKREYPYITVLGDLTDAFLNGTHHLDHEKLINIPKEIINDSEKYPLENAFETCALAPFLFRFLNILISSFQNSKIQYHYELKLGYKARYKICYNDGFEDRVMPVRIVKADDNIYLIQLLYSAADYYNINLRIRLRTFEVDLLFDLDHSDLHGELLYRTDHLDSQFRITEEINIFRGKELFISSMDTVDPQIASAEDIDFVRHLLELSNIGVKRDRIQIHKVNDRIYFIESVPSDAAERDDQTLTDLNTLIVIERDIISIKHRVEKLVIQHGIKVKQTLDVADADIVFKAIRTLDETQDYVVCQKYYNKSENANVDYKEYAAGRYSDSIYTIPPGTPLTEALYRMQEIEDPDDFKKHKYKYYSR